MNLDEQKFLQIEYAQLLGDRTKQEDAIALKVQRNSQGQIKNCIAVVCDGMGGYELGQEISTLASKEIVKEYKFQNPTAYFKEMLDQVNDEVLHFLATKDCSRGGTTMVAAIVIDDYCTIANIGDSRAYLFRKGELYQLTTDENLANDLHQQYMDGYLTIEDYEMKENKEALVNFIGKKELRNHQLIEPFYLEEDAVLLLCSDGLSKSLSQKEMVEILSGSESLRLKTHILIAAANDATENQDNTTVILIKKQ